MKNSQTKRTKFRKYIRVFKTNPQVNKPTQKLLIFSYLEEYESIICSRQEFLTYYFYSDWRYQIPVSITIGEFALLALSTVSVPGQIFLKLFSLDDFNDWTTVRVSYISLYLFLTEYCARDPINEAQWWTDEALWSCAQ